MRETKADFRQTGKTRKIKSLDSRRIELLTSSMLRKRDTTTPTALDAKEHGERPIALVLVDHFA